MNAREGEEEVKVLDVKIMSGGGEGSSV